MTFEPTFTLGAIATVVTMIGGVLTIIGFQRKVRRENEADTRDHTDELKVDFRKVEATLGERITKLETRSAGFMLRAEIEGKIEHEKGNRMMVDAGLKEGVDRNATAITDLKVCVGKPLWPGAVPKDVLWALNWARFGTAVGQPALGDVLTFTRTGGAMSASTSARIAKPSTSPAAIRAIRSASSASPRRRSIALAGRR